MLWSIKEESSSKQSNTRLLSSAICARFRKYPSMTAVVYHFLLGAKIVVWLLTAMTCRLFFGFDSFIYSGLDNMLIYDNLKVNE